MEEVRKRGRPKKEEKEVFEEEISNIENEKQKLLDRLNQIEREEKEELERQEIIQQQAELERKEKLEYEEWKRQRNQYKVPFSDDLIEESNLEEKVKDIRPKENKESETFWGKIFKKNKIDKEGKVAIMLLHPQGDATTLYQDTDKDGGFKIEDEQYNINEHCVYTLKVKKDRIPICILPTWTMIPIGTKAWFELSQERRGFELQRIILKNIKNEERVKLGDEKKKTKLNAKTIWIILVILIGGYIFLKSRGG